MGEPQSLGWVDMWKIFEIIRENVRPATIANLGWAPTTQLGRRVRVVARRAMSVGVARYRLEHERLDFATGMAEELGAAFRQLEYDVRVKARSPFPVTSWVRWSR